MEQETTQSSLDKLGKLAEYKYLTSRVDGKDTKEESSRRFKEAAFVVADEVLSNPGKWVTLLGLPSIMSKSQDSEINVNSIQDKRLKEIHEEFTEYGAVHITNSSLDVWLQPEAFKNVYLGNQRVPYLKADITLQEGLPALYTLHVGNLGISVPVEDMPHTVWLIANAMAIAAGYTSFGEYSQNYNPYKKPKY